MRCSVRLFCVATLCLPAVLSLPGQALAWGATGHRIIGELGAEALPAALPAFLKTPLAIAAIGELAREPDRSRGAGQPHDADLDPGHFIDLDEAGKTLGGSPITAMPATRYDYEITLQAAGTTVTKGGYLFYNLVDGYEQLVKDFAYWRVETAAMKQWTDPAQKKWLAYDLQLRQDLTIRDLGYWSHFVGDASQPMHVSIHYNGWGDYPNPKGYTQDKIHGPFEGPFVQQYVTEPATRAAMTAPAVCADPIQACIAAYLTATNAEVEPVYALWGAGGFKPGDPRGVAFATTRVAAGADHLRDLVAKAWAASEDASVGYPGLAVKAAEAGQPIPFAALYGDD